MFLSDGSAGSENATGDSQKKLDVLSNEMMVQPDNSVLHHFEADNNNEYDTNLNDIDRTEGTLIDIF